MTDRPAPKHTPTARPSDPNAAPERIGRFVVAQLLGRGAFGCVYLAFDPQLERQVAIKVPHADGLTAEFRDRFLREARATATIHHRNVCPVYDAGTDGEVPFIVMHYVVGTTLAALLDRQGAPLPPRHALAIARKLALGMAAAHAKGVVHRDLKPANVLYEAASREVLITDFGLAIMSGDSRATADGAVCGTPAYMSPEQAKGKVGEVGPLSDVYALGVILFRMLTGAVPFTGSVFEVLMQHAEAPPPFPSVVYPGLDPRLDAICVKAMAKRPIDRFPSAQALADALTNYLRADGRTESNAELPFAQAIVEETMTQATAATMRKPAPKPVARSKPQPLAAKAVAPKRRRGRVLALLLVLLLTGGAGAAWLFRADLEALVAKKPADAPAPPSPDAPTLEVAPPPRPQGEARKDEPPVPPIDAKKLVGKWERPVGAPAGWEFDAAGSNTRTYGGGASSTDPYVVSGDTVTTGTTAKTAYTVLKLTDDELQLKPASGAAMTFQRAKPKLVGKWTRYFNKKSDTTVWEFFADGRLVWATSPSVNRTYKVNADRLPWEIVMTTDKNTTVYVVEKYTDDEIEMKPDKGLGLGVTLKRIKP